MVRTAERGYNPSPLESHGGWRKWPLLWGVSGWMHFPGTGNSIYTCVELWEKEEQQETKLEKEVWVSLWWVFCAELRDLECVLQVMRSQQRLLCIGDCNHQFGLGSSLCSNVRTDSIRKKLVTTWGAEFNARDVESCNSGLLKGWRGVNSCVSNHNNIEWSIKGRTGEEERK